MHLGFITFVESIVALAIIAAAVVVGTLLTFNETTLETGRAIRRRGSAAGIAAFVFAWAGHLPAGLLSHFAGDRVGVLVLWASGPVGLVVGLIMPLTRRVVRVKQTDGEPGDQTP